MLAVVAVLVCAHIYHGDCLEFRTSNEQAILSTLPKQIVYVWHTNEPHHTPFPEVESSHPTTSSIPLSSIPTAPIPTVTQTDTTPIIQYSRRARIAQSSALLTIADKPASPAQKEEIGRLKEWVQVLEDKEVVATKQSGEDASIKGRSNNDGEAAAERI
nr:hypothetical protein [Tanacetum cinerariifolium]